MLDLTTFKVHRYKSVRGINKVHAPFARRNLHGPLDSPQKNGKKMAITMHF